MLLPSSIRAFLGKIQKRSHRRSIETAASILRVEALELRELLTTFSVTSLNDSGTGSLRAAIDQANDEVANPGADLIVFDSSLAGGTISLTSNDTNNPFAFGPTAFVINSEIVIDAAGANLSVDAQYTRRILGVLPNANLAMRGLTLMSGVAQGGNSGDTVPGNTGGGGAGLGGAVFNAGTLIIYDTVFSDNAAYGGDAGDNTSTQGPTNGSGGGAAGFNGANGGNFNTGGGGGGIGGNGNGVTGGANQAGAQAGETIAGTAGGGGGAGANGTAFSIGGFGGGGGGASDYGGYGAGNGGFAAGGGGGASARNGGNGGFGGGGGGSHTATPGLGGFGGGNGLGLSGSKVGAGGGGAGMGGAIFNNGGLLTIVNSTFDSNRAVGGSSSDLSNQGNGLGGAIFNRNGTAVIVDTVFSNNSASRPSESNDYGGAIYYLGDGAGSTNTVQRLTNSITGALYTDNNTYVDNVGLGNIASRSINGGNTLSGPVADDFGDAPDTFATRLASNGPRHRAVGPTLGTARDTEEDGQPDALALGDDLGGIDDEDGVTFGNYVVGQTGATATVQVNDAPFGARLTAWADFNGDGIFSGAEELIANNLVVQNGSNTITFDIPLTARSVVTARFRLSTTSRLGVTGDAADGEVEDYRMPSIQTAVSVTVAPLTTVEDSGTSLVYTLTRTGDLSVPAIVDVTLDGTATRGIDYTTTGSGAFIGNMTSIAFGIGVGSVQLTVTPIGDFVFEPDETVTVTISANESYAVGVSGSATATIVNDDAAGFVITESDDVTVIQEAGSTDTFSVVLLSAPTTDVVIDLTTANPQLVALSTSQLIFNSTNWSVPQTVTVTSTADEFTNGATSTTITASINDALSPIPFGVLADQTVTVYLMPVNDNDPRFTSPDHFDVPENTSAVGTVMATDHDLPAETITYSISGGADASLFKITPEGVLTFLNPPDYERPTDSDRNQIYEVEITADDNNGISSRERFEKLGGRTAVQTVLVSVTPVNDNTPVFSTATAYSISENSTSAIPVLATDADLPAQTLSYSISGGVDAARFILNPVTGDLSFVATPDFEIPGDDGGNHVYDLEVTVSDGQGGTAMQALTITITPVNDNSPVFSSPVSFEVPENTTHVGNLIATDADLPGQAISFSIAGGEDASRFQIDETTGTLTFKFATDFEDPVDTGNNNTFEVQVAANDNAGRITTQTLNITVLPVNDNSPKFVSPDHFTVVENTLVVGSISATDADRPLQTLTYSITGGLDRNRFDLDAKSGALTFKAAPNFENPDDSDADHIYEIQISADDGQGLSTVQTIAITTTPINEFAPVFTSPNTVSVVENTTVVTTVAAADADRPQQQINYTITGGDDRDLFTIDPTTGLLTFRITPDFENPANLGGDNLYRVEVTADDNGGLTTVQSLTITVLPENDLAPVFVTPSEFTVAENSTFAGSVAATDADLPGQTVTYSITGGADAARFLVDPASGVLTFKVAPDFEVPTDTNTDQQYELQVTANDGQGLNTVQSITVIVAPVNEFPPVFTTPEILDIPENSLVVGTITALDADRPLQQVTFAVTGGADASLFDLDSVTGILSFKTAPDFEIPIDAGIDNVYEVQITADDNGGLSTVKTFTIRVSPLNDNLPVFLSPDTYIVAENTLNVGVIAAEDADRPLQTLSYSISGGSDALLFQVDSATGALRFKIAPDYEVPSDLDANHIYELQVSATDGNRLIAMQSISITVTPVNEFAPVVLSAETFTVPENLSEVGTIAAIDADLPSQQISYSISGGLDAALFEIDGTTGILVFKNAPDFELPLDAGTNNIYNVDVTASDNEGLTTTRSLTVTVLPVNEHSPVFSSSAAFDVPENQQSVGQVIATDADLPWQTITYSITGGLDASRFALDSTTGILTLMSAADFESPDDIGADRIYDLEVTADDGQGFRTVQLIAITITPVNEFSPIFVSPNAVDVSENTLLAATIQAIDADRPLQTISYSISGGADADQFVLNSETGGLTFKTAPDYEQPNDSGSDRTYHVEITASDNNGLTTVQQLTITVLPLNDNLPVVTSGNTYTIPEGTTPVGQVTATDADQPAQTVTFSIVAEQDGDLFQISPSGQLEFKVAPDYLNPADLDGNNTYHLVVKASDGNKGESLQAVTVTVTFVSRNTSPRFTSNDNFVISESTLLAGTVVAVDSDVPAQSLTYSLTAGADLALFDINPTTGILAFKVAPDFEHPLDSNLDNNYELLITVNDGNGGVATQSVIITITNVFEPPTISITNRPGSYYFGKVRAFVDPTIALVSNDVQQPDYSDARLTVSIVANRDRKDVLSIHTKTAPKTLIRLDDDNVLYNDVIIGSFRGGKEDQPELVIDFNSAATNEAVDALLKRINFTTSRRRVPQPVREVQFELANVNGQDLPTVSRTIEIVRAPRRRHRDRS